MTELTGVNFSLLTTRVLEMRVIRMKEFPTAQTQIRTGAQITMEAKPGTLQERNNAFGIAAKIVLELRFAEETSPGVEGSPYAEIQLSMDSIFEAQTRVEGDPAAYTFGADIMNRLTASLVSVAETHIAQIVTMTRMPVTVSAIKLLEIAQQPMQIRHTAVQ